MKRRLLLGLAVAALGASPALTAAPARKAPAASTRSAQPGKVPARQDWSKSVAPTAEGGFRMGNPGAPLKLIEYGSFTCSHCADFAEQSVPVLIRDHVKSGRLSFEYRMFVRDPYDVTAALVARCASPARFFGLSHDIFAAHDSWTDRFNRMTPEQVKAIDALPLADRLTRFASIAGFDTMALKAGVSPVKLKQCLADDKALDQLVAMRQLAINTLRLEVTPSFLLNGKITQAHSLSELQALLKLPGG